LSGNPSIEKEFAMQTFSNTRPITPRQFYRLLATNVLCLKRKVLRSIGRQNVRNFFGQITPDELCRHQISYVLHYTAMLKRHVAIREGEDPIDLVADTTRVRLNLDAHIEVARIHHPNIPYWLVVRLSEYNIDDQKIANVKPPTTLLETILRLDGIGIRLARLTTEQAALIIKEKRRLRKNRNSPKEEFETFSPDPRSEDERRQDENRRRIEKEAHDLRRAERRLRFDKRQPENWDQRANDSELVDLDGMYCLEYLLSINRFFNTLAKSQGVSEPPPQHVQALGVEFERRSR